MSQRSPLKSPIVKSDANQELDFELALRVEASFQPPIAEIEAALQKYLSAKALPSISTPSPSVQDKRAVERALFSVLVITSCESHLRRGTKLDSCLLKAWPGIWRWLQFFDDQCCQRDRYGDGLKMKAIVSIPSTIIIMALSKAVRRQVASTPGVVAMIAGYWKDEGRYPDIEKAFAVASTLHPFTTALNALLEPENIPSNCLPDLTATLGSTKAVATPAIEHMTAVLAEKPPDFKTIRTHISLIINLSTDKEPKLVFAMLNQGTIPSMVQTLLWLEKQSASGPEDELVALQCVEMCFLTLYNTMVAINGPSWISQSLDAGILPAILKSAPRLKQSSRRTSSLCSSLLSHMLCQHLVYRSVLGAAAKALRRVERLELDDGLGGPIWEAWAVFKRLAQERISLKESLDQPKANRTFCRRFHCMASIDPDKLLCCSGCLETFYCDRACQRMDWKVHKSECRETQQLLREGIYIATSPADRGFIGDIVENDLFQNNKSVEKLRVALKAPSAQRSPSKFFFLLDYTQIPVNITVVPVAELHRKDLVWNDMADKALQSDGTLMTARARVQRGGNVVFPSYLISNPLEKEHFGS